MELKCPRCKNRKIWDRKKQPEGPGTCPCGAWANWIANPKPEPLFDKGYVIVHSYKGKQELHGPHWREDPDKWIKE